MASARHPTLTAKAAGLIGCRACGRVSPGQTHICPRCGGRLEPNRGFGLQRVWAWLAAGVICYIPANLYPMLRTATVATGTAENTIVGGVVELLHHHAYGVAAIVFGASVVVPMAKFIAIAVLALSLRSHARLSSHRRHRLLEIMDFIGRWSMVDVFVVAILSSLVQLGYVVSIHPGPAAALFALSVAFTMLAAQSFDPRLIWEKDQGPSA
ncbi:paraquat-inducible protein A [Rhodobacter aestuarii]|uniref:Paraquat-inducible protein A n=1 Tax=Rhodobacter aestuarii TaxID=453582 RepID=A0A1N7NGN3_9RHOB|nr:paraquat-inducible protein A [Rhodobacter aestuarii]PTV96462.1 paraquat-inducible protein A [Rhodobacter aestuarii]SIS97563.1 paraquat-inducible protein A [Rhodobacter aestuarii]